MPGEPPSRAQLGTGLTRKGRDIALRCPRPRSSGRNAPPKPGDSDRSFRRLTLRSATGTAQRAIPTKDTVTVLRCAPRPGSAFAVELVSLVGDSG